MYPQVKVQSFIPQEAKSKNEMGLAFFFPLNIEVVIGLGSNGYFKYLYSTSIRNVLSQALIYKLVSGFLPGLAVYRYTE